MAYQGTYIVGEELALLEQAKPLMKGADLAIDRLERIIVDQNRDALIAFIENELYQTIDPITDQVGRPPERPPN